MPPALPASPLLAVVSAQEPMSFLQDLGYQSVGMVIVLGSLALMAGFLGLSGRWFAAYQKRFGSVATGSAMVSQSSSPTAPGAASELPADLRAAIVAAVYVSLGEGHRILSIQSSPTQLAAWSMEGRRQIFLSHRVR